MRKTSAVVAVALSLLLGSANYLMANNTEHSRYIVRFKSEVKTLEHKSHSSVVSRLQENLNRNIRTLGNVIKSPNLNHLWVANSVAMNASEEEIARISKLPNVAEVVPNEYSIYIEKDIDKKAVKSNKAAQWGVERVNAPKVWKDYKIDGAGVVVGVIDTGIAGEHPLLKEKIIGFKDFTRDNCQVPTDTQGHGSHVSGTIAAGDGVGVAPGSRLLVARVFDTSGGTTAEALLNSMQWMIDPDGNPETDDAPALVNNSWGSDNSTNKTFWTAVENWVHAGILPVFAAGNNGAYGGKVGTPAAFPHSWAVAATTATDGHSYFSSQGPVSWDGVSLMKPDIAAPGSNIVSCDIKSGLVSNSGTSMACPHMTGVAALVYQADPSISIEQIRLISEDTSIDFGTEGKDGKFGSGLVDAHKLVGKVLQNANLASAFEAYESALHTEKALIGLQAVSPLAEPLANSIIERAKSLDEGQFQALAISVNQGNSDVAKELLKEVTASRIAEQLHK